MSDGTLRSSQVHDEFYGLIYPIGGWVEAKPEAKAKGYGPLVFKTSDQAYRFKVAYGDNVNRMYKCLVRGVKDIVPPMLGFVLLTYFFVGKLTIILLKYSGFQKEL